jgi:hypothetical protein
MHHIKCSSNIILRSHNSKLLSFSFENYLSFNDKIKCRFFCRHILEHSVIEQNYNNLLYMILCKIESLQRGGRQVMLPDAHLNKYIHI